MRHGKKINHLGRTTSHRNAMLSNMASSLIMHKRIETTVAKAKALRKFVEPLLTKSKSDTTHSRRTVFATLQNKESIKELYDAVAGKIANRPGGYTRIIKLSDNRLGDNAEICIIELVDYNEILLEAKSAGEAKATTRRSRSKKKADTTDAAAPVAAAATEAPAAVVSEEAAAATDAPTETLHEGETRDEKSEEAAS